LEMPSVRGPAPSLREEGATRTPIPRGDYSSTAAHPIRFAPQAGNVLGKVDDTPMTLFIGGSLAAIAYLVYVAIST
jgi:hypothetical protein